MRIVLISDTHELHRELVVPHGDLLIHAGDITVLSKRPWMYRHFDIWLGELPHRHKIVVPGNNDYLLEEPRERGSITNATLLIDAGVEADGISIWGSPLTTLYGGAFGMSSAADRRRHWAQIPKGLDILVTHTPPSGVLDCGSNSERHEGCPELREAVLQARPRVHVFGHIHGGYGTFQSEHTLFVNASASRRRWKPEQKAGRD